MRMRPPPGAAQASLKSRQDWLTEADGAVERFVSERLLALFPEDGFQGEEEGFGQAHVDAGGFGGELPGQGAELGEVEGGEVLGEERLG